MPSVIIEIGMRATKAASEKVRTPGTASSWRYGRSIPRPYDSPQPVEDRRVPQDGVVPDRKPDPAPYDALLVVSFGGPEGPDDVLPFLENVTRGRGVPRERLLAVSEHYFAVGGISPINEQNRALLTAIEADFATTGIDLPVYWGNRNWHPLLADTVARMAEAGVRRALALLTSAYSSYSGCRQYREDLAAAVAPLRDRAPRIDRLRHYFNHPAFIETMTEHTLVAVGRLPPAARADAQLVFVTHSIPSAMNAGSGPSGGAYAAQHEEVARLVASRVSARIGREIDYDLVYCSRSGPATQRWLEPDVNDHLRTLRAGAVVVFVPIGFVSDHMEVGYDIDTQAAATAARLGLVAVRAPTVGSDARFVAGLRDMVLERAAGERGEQPVREALGAFSPSHDVCPAGCCPNPRGARAALCGMD